MFGMKAYLTCFYQDNTHNFYNAHAIKFGVSRKLCISRVINKQNQYILIRSKEKLVHI